MGHKICWTGQLAVEQALAAYSISASYLNLFSPCSSADVALLCLLLISLFVVLYWLLLPRALP